MAESLRKFGLRVEVHADHFAPEAPDTEWLTVVGGRGWVVLTKNRRILTNPLEIVCLLRARVFAFVLKQSADGELTGEQIATAYIAAMPAIHEHLRTSRPPFVACVLPSGRVSKVEIPGEFWKWRKQ